MGNYLDNTYAAIDGVILHYTGEDITLRVPAKFANMPISTIGGGSFMDSSRLQQVVIPQGVTTVGGYAFSGCDNLTDVFLPGTVEKAAAAFAGCPKLARIHYYRLEVSRHRYNAIKFASTACGNGKYVANVFPAIRRVREAVDTSNVKIATMIQSDIDKLFISQNLDEEKGREALTRNLGCLDFRGNVSCAVEEEAFADLVASDWEMPMDVASEKQNDQFARVDRLPPIEKTAICLLDDAKTKQENGKCYLSLTIQIGYHFWQSKVPLRVNNTLYYIYRRHYLSSETNLNYIRKDVAVFKGAKLVTNRKEAQQVYAKYRLLSIL